MKKINIILTIIIIVLLIVTAYFLSSNDIQKTNEISLSNSTERINNIKLKNFILKDQFENRHSNDLIKGKVTIAIASDDRKGAEYLGLWARKLIESKKKVKVIGFCNLKGYPFFLPNSNVRNILKKKVPGNVKVLIDWKGTTFAKLFGKGVSVVIFKSGKKVATVRGRYSKARLDKVLKAMK